jgi:hypothetical protein
MQSEYDKEIEALRIERAANREKFWITKSTEQAMNAFRGIGTWIYGKYWGVKAV